MHIPYPTILGAFAATAGIAALQFGALAVMAFKAARKPGRANGAPAVSVIIPCFGRLDDYRDALLSLINQDYAGRAEFLLVAAHDDEARPEMERLAAEHASRGVRALFHGESPVHCTAKNLSLARGAALAAAESEVLVFSEQKHLARGGWLASIVGALLEPGVSVATSLPLPFPHDREWPGLCHAAWFLWAVPFFYVCPWVVGPSFAIRRRDYEAWKVAGSWLKAVSDDNVLTVMAWRKGGRIAGVPEAAGFLDRRLSWSQVYAVTARYLLCMRTYMPAAWLAAALPLIAKAIILSRALFPGPHLPLLSFLFLCEAAYLGAAAWLAGRLFPGWDSRWPREWRPPWAWAALAAPAAQALFLAAFTRSALSTRTVWGGVSYRVRGPYEVEAEAGPAPGKLQGS